MKKTESQVRAETERLKARALNHEAQILLQPLLKRENIQARTVFYPGDLPPDEEE